MKFVCKKRQQQSCNFCAKYFVKNRTARRHSLAESLSGEEENRYRSYTTMRYKYFWVNQSFNINNIMIFF